MEHENQRPQDTRKTSPDTAADSTKHLKESATKTAGEARDAARDMATERMDAAKGTTADEMRSISDALRHAAEDVREGSAQERAFTYVADTLAEFSDTVRSKDLNHIVRDISDFGRRNPATFLGGAALLGFVATRAARASQRSGHDHDDMQDGYAHAGQEPRRTASPGTVPGQTAGTVPGQTRASPTPTPTPSPTSKGSAT